MAKTQEQTVKVYKKEASYRVGEKIYHDVFDDEGLIQKKEVCTGDYQKIIVKFKNVGIKTLIEKKAARKARLGDSIAIRYQATLPDGEEFESSRRKKLVLGKNKLFPWVEKQIVGMKSGEIRKIVVPPEKAHGLYNDDLVMTVSSRSLDETDPEPGALKMVRTRDGGLLEARISAIEGNSVTLDGNHPLAGMQIEYEVELVDFLDS